MRGGSSWETSVSGDNDSELLAELQAANSRLAQSLKRCRKLVADYRSRLARKSNPANDEGSVFPWGNKPGE